MTISLKHILFLLLLAFSIPAMAQTACSPFMGIGNGQFFDNSGVPLTNGVLYSFQAGTSTQQATFTDSTCTAQNVNPITFGTGARATIWLTTANLYKFVLCAQNDGASCAAGDVLFSVDQVPGGATGGGGGGGAPFISNSANPATSGILRLASGDTVCWRNTANSSNLCFSKDTSDLLSWAGGSFKLPEVGAPAGVTGFDILYADNTAHRWKIINNGGSAVQVVGSGNDISTSDAVTALHFGATQETLASTAPTTGQLLQFNGTSIVGSPNPFTLNKQDQQGSATTGNGTDQTVYTYSMPSGSLTSGKCMDVTSGFQKVSGTNSLTLKLNFGATTVSISSTTNALWLVMGKICNNTGSTTAQWELWSISQGAAGFINTGFASPAENTGGSITISLTANVASPDTWQGRGWTVITEP